MAVILEDIKNEERKLVLDVIEKFNLAKQAKQNAFKVTPSELLDFYLGRQIGKEKPEEIDVISNCITEVIDAGISLILQTPFTIELIPNRQEDISKIQQLQQVLQYYWEQVLDMKKKLKELLGFLKIYGTAFLYPHYIIENNNLKIKVDVLSSEDIYPDPSAKKNEDLEFIFYAMPIPLAKIRRWYPTRGYLVKEETIVSSSVGNKSRSSYAEIIHEQGKIIRPILGKSEGGRVTLPSATLIFGFLKDDTQGELINYKCYCKNCKIFFRQESFSKENLRCNNCKNYIPAKHFISLKEKQILPLYPQGRMVVIANNILLDDRENPYYDFPFLRFINRMTTTYWGLGDVEYLMGEQIGINKYIRYATEIIKKIVKRPIFADKGAIEEEIRTTSFGDLIEKQPGKAINWMDMPTVPYDIFRMIDLFRGQIDNKAGLRDRIGAKTATEVGLLEEEEQRRQTSLLGDIEYDLKKVILHILHILINYHTYTEQLALDYKKGEYILFQGIDYKNLLFDVKVKFQIEIVLSKMVRHQQALQTLTTIMTLLQSQLISFEKAQNIVNKLMADLNLS